MHEYRKSNTSEKYRGIIEWYIPVKWACVCVYLYVYSCVHTISKQLEISNYIRLDKLLQISVHDDLRPE